MMTMMTMTNRSQSGEIEAPVRNWQMCTFAVSASPVCNVDNDAHHDHQNYHQNNHQKNHQNYHENNQNDD